MTNKPLKSRSLFQWIWHSFLKTALIPLVLVELVFICIYFLTNSWSQQETIKYLKTEVSDELSELVIEKSNVIQEQLMSISYTTNLLTHQFEHSLSMVGVLLPEDISRLKYSPDGMYYTFSDKATSGAAIFYSGIVPIGEKEREKVAQVLTTEPLLKDIIKTQPLASQVYLNTFDSLNVIYPYFDVISQYTPQMDIPSYNFYYEADLAHNPSKSVRWTDSYLDPAGRGWMTSAIAPVYNQSDFLEGVVGIDVTISTITDQILNMEIPWGGYGLLIGKDGTILALPHKGEPEWGLDELTNHTYSEAILKDTFKPEAFNIYNRSELSSLSKNIEELQQGFGDIKLNKEKKVVAWGTISETGWKLLIIVPEENIYAQVNVMSKQLFRIGTFMIAGLIFFYCIFFTVLFLKSKKMSLDISKPLVEINAIALNIGQGDYFQKAPEMGVQELQDTALRLVEMGNQLGSANQSLLLTETELRKRESDLSALVNAMDDVILEADENGLIVNVWNRNSDLLAKEFQLGGTYTVNVLYNGVMISSNELIKNTIQNHTSELIEYEMETNIGLRWFQARISYVDNRNKAVVISARDITARKEMEHNLLLAKEEAEKASRAKSQFLSSMSHELRTPMNAILGFSQILHYDDETPLTEPQEECVREITKAGQHLLTLINEVLDLSRIESGRMSLSIENIHVDMIIAETISLIKPLAEQYNIVFDYPTIPDENLYIHADLTRVKQILINLLSNAIKYNRPNGKVTFYYEIKDNNLVFNIVDTGYGISEEDQKIIFQPFQRLNYQNNTTIEGTGIGLSVAKELAELMNGAIGLESTLNIGSHFYAVLPMAPYVQKYEEAEIQATSQELQLPNAYVILYVEDNPANLALVRSIIKTIPSTIFYSATLGEISIDLARTYRPDLILLDINLPGIDGYEVFKRLKQYPETLNIPIIAVTANIIEHESKKALAMGFSDFITKPIDVPLFVEKVNQHIRKLHK